MTIFENQKNEFASYNLVAGVDEAGRGPLAGPLVVSAVILNPDAFHEKLNDSKKLSEKMRELLYDWVIENSLDYSIKIVSVADIDRLNILQATLHGMKASVQSLKTKPDIALLDGNKIPADMKIPCVAAIKGDMRFSSIAAASILSKVTRDRLMLEIDKKYPQYDFKQHKGYPTEKHVELLRKHGMCPEHRRSFRVKF